MRCLPVCAVVALSLAAGGAAAAAVAPPATPSVKTCVATWNAAPGLRAGAPARRAFVQVVAAGTGMSSWTRTSSVSLSGPGCAVWVVEPSRHVLVVYRSWSPRTTAAWRAPVAFTSLPSGDRANATVGTDGRLKLG
jgi:hypothetical protein